MSAWAASGPHRRDAPHERDQGLGVVDVRGGHTHYQRHALGIGQHVDLGARLPAIGRIRTRQRSPLLARKDAASTMTVDQSISPADPSWSRPAPWSLPHTPAADQSRNRRAAVGHDTPNDGGSIRHEHPVVTTYTIAVNTTRSSSPVVPPPCGRATNRGINGSTSSAIDSQVVLRRRRRRDHSPDPGRQSRTPSQPR